MLGRTVIFKCTRESARKKYLAVCNLQSLLSSSPFSLWEIEIITSQFEACLLLLLSRIIQSWREKKQHHYFTRYAPHELCSTRSMPFSCTFHFCRLCFALCSMFVSFSNPSVRLSNPPLFLRSIVFFCLAYQNDIVWSIATSGLFKL